MTASPLPLERPRQDPRRILQQPDDADDRRRIDRAAVGLVVEADVAAGNRHVERAARLGDSLDRLDQLPHDLGPLWIAEVQAVGRADRDRAGAGDVPRRFRDRQHRAAPGIEVAVPAVAIRRNRQPACRPLDADDAGAEASGGDRVGPHHRVVLPVGPALARNRRRREQRQQGVLRRRPSSATPGRASRTSSR